MTGMTKQIFLGEMLLTVYSLRYLSAKLHRSPKTLRRWEFQKMIPKPILRGHTKDGNRWYTDEEVKMYVRLAEEECIINGKKFSETKFTSRTFGEAGILRRKIEKEIDKWERAKIKA